MTAKFKYPVERLLTTFLNGMVDEWYVCWNTNITLRQLKIPVDVFALAPWINFINEKWPPTISVVNIDAMIIF